MNKETSNLNTRKRTECYDDVGTALPQTYAGEGTMKRVSFKLEDGEQGIMNSWKEVQELEDEEDYLFEMRR